MQDLLDEFDLEFEDVWLDEKEFNWETVSYVITDILEWFPTVWQEISLKILNSDEKSETERTLIIKAVEVEEAKIWKVEARIEESPKTKEEKKDNQE